MSGGIALPRWARRALLVAAGLVVGLGLGEAIGRLDGLARGNDLVFMAPMFYPQDIYVQGGGMTYPNPAFTGEIKSFGYAIRPRFSRWGTRGGDPTPGVPTWIAVGDSFTIALQVEEEETFSALLAQKLGVQVVNAGVDGYSTWREALRAVQLGRAFPPQGVVAAFFTGNDFFDNREAAPRSVDAAGLGPGEAGAPAFTLPPDRMGFRAPGWVRWLRDHSVLAAHAWSWREARELRAGRDPSARRFRDELAIFTVEGRTRVVEETRATTRAFGFLRDACQRVGARCVVAVIPPAFVMDTATAARTFASVGLVDATPDLDGAQAAAVAAARGAGLEVCDLMPTLRAAHAAGERPYLPFDGHLSVAGHQRAAEALAGCIGR